MINKKLEKKILSDIPNEYTNLETAILIYKRLCETLQYSFDVYLDEKNALPFFTNVKNLEKIDGEKNKDVVCVTFNAILSELFERAEVTDRIIHKGYELEGNNRFKAKHFPVIAIIDGIEYSIDGTDGIIDQNDLVLSKYSTHKPIGWQFGQSHTPSQAKQLSAIIEKVYNENKTLENNLEKYFKNNDSDFNIPIETRMQLFLEFSQFAEYSLLGFNKLLKLKHIFFKQKELLSRKNTSLFIENKNVDVRFLKQKDTNEFVALVFFNPAGFTNYRPKENMEKLQIYEISLKNKTYKLIPREEIKRRFDNKYYLDTSNFPEFLPPMANDELEI